MALAADLLGAIAEMEDPLEIANRGDVDVDAVVAGHEAVLHVEWMLRWHSVLADTAWWSVDL